MNKIIALLTVMMTLSLPGQLKAEEYPLESQQLAWRILKPLPESVIETIAVSQLSDKQKQDEGQRQSAIQSLSDDVAGMAMDDLFMISDSIAYSEYDSKARAFILNPVIPENNMAVKNRFFPSIQSGQLPGYFNLLIPNYTLANQLPMSERKAQALIDSRADLPRQLKRRFYVEVFFRPVEYQQGRYIQTVIERIDFYDHKNTRNLITTVREKRKPAKVISSSLLAEGITSKAIPIHNFTILDIRMLEILSEGNDSLGECERIADSDSYTGHRLIECEREFSQRSIRMSRLLRYVGGRLADLEVTLLDNPEEKALQRLIYEMKREFGLPDAREGNPEWSSHGIQFSYYPERLYEPAEGKPFLLVTSSVNHDNGKQVGENSQAEP